MTQDKGRDETRGHEAQGGQHGARRQARDATYAMAAGAAGAVARADAHQQTGANQLQRAAIEADRWQGAEQPPQQRRQQQAEEEQCLLAAPFCAWLQKAAEQTADTGHAAIGQGKDGGGQTDQRASSQGAPGGEAGPVDVNCRPSQNRR